MISGAPAQLSLGTQGTRPAMSEFQQLAGVLTDLRKTMVEVRDSMAKIGDRIQKPEGGGGTRKMETSGMRSGRQFESFKKFGGGEAEWQEWSNDYKISVDRRHMVMSEAMELVKKLGKAEKDVLDWKDVKDEIIAEQGAVNDDGV